jgi:molybdenum cofactor cytidylyltransferase
MGGEIVGILLAAGRGSRFGSDKLMHPLTDGRPMAEIAARRLLPACDRVIAVCRPGSEALARQLADCGCRILPCSEADSGMGHSLAAAVRATPEAAGWLVALADMPFIETATHQRVSDELRSGAGIVTVEYEGRRGHPVGFAQAYFPELIALSGDQGARRLLVTHAARIKCLALGDPGICRDIDTVADLVA